MKFFLAVVFAVCCIGAIGYVYLASRPLPPGVISGKELADITSEARTGMSKSTLVYMFGRKHIHLSRLPKDIEVVSTEPDGQGGIRTERRVNHLADADDHTLAGRVVTTDGIVFVAIVDVDIILHFDSSDRLVNLEMVKTERSI